MSFTRMMEGNEAAAWGAKLTRAQVIPAYPITPQTELISNIATTVAITIRFIITSNNYFLFNV